MAGIGSVHFDGGGGGSTFFWAARGGFLNKNFVLMAKNCPGGSKMPLILYKKMQNRYRRWPNL